MSERNAGEELADALGKLALSCMAVLIGGLITMYTWNGSIPEVFGLQRISFMQALSIFFLCQTLFGSHRR